MIPLTPPRGQVAVTDPIAQFLLSRHADPELAMPTTPLVVDVRCAGNLGEIMTFRSLYYLSRLFQAAGRDDFTVKEIHRYAPGISGTRIPSYLRGLCEKGLVDVVGHRETPGLKRNYWTARYHIDMDRLRQESALVAAELLRAENLPLPRRDTAPAPGQLDLDLEGGAGDRFAEEHGRSGAVQPTTSREHGGVGAMLLGGTADSPQVGGPFSGEHGGHTLRRTVEGQVGGPFSGEHGGHTPGGTAEGQVGGPFSGEHGGHTPGGTAGGQADGPFSGEHSRHTPGGTARGQVGDTVPHGSRPPFSRDAAGGMDGSQEGGMDGREHSALALTAGALRAIVKEEVGQSIQELLAAFTLPQRVTHTLIASDQEESMPAAPPDEPAVDAGPVATWAALSGRTATPAEVAQIREIVRGYDGPSGGYGAYWLVRAMSTVALDGKELTLRYCTGPLRRMQQQQCWSTKELQRPPERGEAPLARGSASGGRVERGKARPPHQGELRTSSSTPSPAPDATGGPGRLLSAELRACPAVRAYLDDVPPDLPDLMLAPDLAEQIRQRVSNLALWTSVRANWRADRHRYSNVAGMLDRYRTEEEAVGEGRRRATAAPAPAPAPELSDCDIREAPDISDAEREHWLTRYHAAPEPERPAILQAFWTWWTEQYKAKKHHANTPEAAPEAAPEVRQIWNLTLGTIQAQVGRQEFDTWLRFATLVSLDTQLATIRTSSQLHKETLEHRYEALIRRALGDVLGHPVHLAIIAAS